MSHESSLKVWAMKLSLAVVAAFLFAAALVGRGLQSPKISLVGAEACASCHSEIYSRWADTIHGKMIQAATPKAVLARTSGNAGERDSRFWRDGRFYIADEDGTARPVHYTLGNRRVQHYLTTYPNGEIRVLKSTWDVRRKQWFHSSEIVPGPPGFIQLWNSLCFNCHVTQQEQDVKGFDPESQTFHTTWVESSASCERCHGPMGPHGATLKSDAAGRAGGIAASASSFDKLMMCGQCHWQKTVVETGYHTTKYYLDYYAPVLTHTDLESVANPGGWADGRPNRFSNEAKAFFLSGCFQSGQALCVSCHDPHWNRTDGNEQLMNRPDELCIRCHAGNQKETHTHHAAGSTGSSCTGCHMPKTVSGVKDTMRDHTMLGPVPENTVDYKIPNACNECHTDRSANWAADIVSGWYPDRNPRPRLRALAFSMAKRRDAKAVAPLIKLATDKNENPMIRASAAGYLAFFPGPLPAAVLPRLVSDPEPFVRIETARALGIVGQDGAVEALARLLTDPYRSVRVQAASALVKLGFSRGENGLKPGHTALPAFANALSEYRRSLQIENDIPEVLVELGFLELFAGRLQSAAKAYRQALQFDAKQADAHIGLALVDLAQGDRKGAVDQAKRAVAISGKPEHRKVLERLTVSAP